MPILLTDREQCELREGRHSLGGDGPDAVRLAPLLAYPLAGTITIRDGAETTIQRLTSRIPLRVNGTMLGAVPEVLVEGASIQVGDVRITYRRQAEPPVTVTAAPPPRQADLATQVMATLARPGVAAALVSLQSGKVVKLAGERVLVGRSEDADVVLGGAGVSRRHALLVPEGEGWVLTDESTNGSFVNGARIDGATRLHPGDVVAFGEEHFRFGHLDAFSAGAGMPASLARVELAQGRWARRTHLIDRPVCTIGRGAHNDLRLDDESVSPSHATLLLKGESWFLSDLRSAAGTWLDGYRVAGERPLAAGAVIRVGEVKLTFWPGAVQPASQEKRPAPGMFQRVMEALFVRPREHAEERRRAVR